MENTESYYMNIPATVWDSELKANAKLCYGHITVLANKKGFAFANNAYFARVLNVSKTTASRYISELESLGVIKTQLVYKENSKEVETRKIFISSMGIDLNDRGPIDQNDGRPTDQNDKDNNTSNNNTSINILDVPSVDDIKGKIFFKIVELYPKNRIGNRQHGLKKFKKLDIEQCKLAAINLKRYLKVVGTYVKSLQNYIEHECYTEEWLHAEESKKINNKPDTKKFSGTYDDID